MTDLAICASDFGEGIYRTGFHYYGEVLKAGMPRNDRLIFPNIERNKKVRDMLGLEDNEKVLLFAPTFRDNADLKKQQIMIDIPQTLDCLSRNGEKWKCLLRSHALAKFYDNTMYLENVIDVSDFPDMTDLLCISDMLITDYSSCAEDLILSDKPIIIAAFDIDEYKRECRSFNYDIQASGHIIAYDQEQLNRILTTKTEEDYVSSCKKAKDFYKVHETGKSAEMICERIISHIEELKKREN